MALFSVHQNQKADSVPLANIAHVRIPQNKIRHIMSTIVHWLSSVTSYAESLFLWDSDSGLKSDTDSWTCVIVAVYWVNDADRQILNIFQK